MDGSSLPPDSDTTPNHSPVLMRKQEVRDGIHFGGTWNPPLIPVNVKMECFQDKNIYKVTGWCGLEQHKVFYHESFIDADIAPEFTSKLNNQSFASVWRHNFGHHLTIKKLIFKPVKMPEMACRELGVAKSSFGILVEKHRATRDNAVVQIDFEYWRHDSVELVID